MGLETRRRKTLDYTTDLNVDEIKYKEPNTTAKPEEQPPQSKEDLLRKFGLFTEQEAGKATIHSNIDDKEDALDFEKNLLALEKARNSLMEL